MIKVYQVGGNPRYYRYIGNGENAINTEMLPNRYNDIQGKTADRSPRTMATLGALAEMLTEGLISYAEFDRLCHEVQTNQKAATRAA